MRLVRLYRCMWVTDVFGQDCLLVCTHTHTNIYISPDAAASTRDYIRLLVQGFIDLYRVLYIYIMVYIIVLLLKREYNWYARREIKAVGKNNTQLFHSIADIRVQGKRRLLSWQRENKREREKKEGNTVGANSIFWRII